MNISANLNQAAGTVWQAAGLSDVAATPSMINERHERRRSAKSVESHSSRRYLEMQEWSTSRRVLACVLENKKFEFLMGLIIMSNLVVLVAEVNFDVTCSGNCDLLRFTLVNIIYLSIYTAELSARLYVYRRSFWRKAWNLLDLVIVATGIVDMILDLSSSDAGPAKLIMRLFRIGRMARGVRLLAFFPQLNRLILLLGGALTPLFWGLVLIIVMIVFWSIIAVELIKPLMGRIDFGADGDYCQEALSTVWYATVFFFQTHVAQDEWGKCIVPIIMYRSRTAALFLLANVTVQLGLLNIIVSAVVDSAVCAREKDNQQRAIENRHTELSRLEDWRGLFEQLDKNSDGQVSLRELLDGFDTEEEVREYMTGLNINRDDLRSIFDLMDADCSGDLSYHELVDTFVKAQSQDQRIYLMTVKLQTQQILHTLRQQGEALQGLYSIMGKTGDWRGVESTSRSPRRSEGFHNADELNKVDPSMERPSMNTRATRSARPISAREPPPPSRWQRSFLSAGDAASNKPSPCGTSFDSATLKATPRSITSGHSRESKLPLPDTHEGIPHSSFALTQPALVPQLLEGEMELPVTSEKQAPTAKRQLFSTAAPTWQQNEGVISRRNLSKRIDIDHYGKLAESSSGKNKNIGIMYSAFESVAPVWIANLSARKERQKAASTGEISRSLPQLNLSPTPYSHPYSGEHLSRESSRNSTGPIACREPIAPAKASECSHNDSKITHEQSCSDNGGDLLEIGAQH